jgi:hypothetical protein
MEVFVVRSHTICVFSFVIFGSIGLSGCARPEEPIQGAEQPVNAAPTPEAALPPGEQTPQLAAPQTSSRALQPAPKPEEVQDAVKRIFKNVVTIDADRRPNFVAGDFNADGSQDLAVMVKPAGQDTAYLELNNELANWLIREPRKIIVAKAIGDVRGSQVRTRPDQIRKGDELIAVIHGFGPTGWRNPDARQTYLLKGVAGANMRSEAVRDLAKAKTDLPLLDSRVINNGDVISETLDGEHGLLFWTGSAYSWHRQAENSRPKSGPQKAGGAPKDSRNTQAKAQE